MAGPAMTANQDAAAGDARQPVRPEDVRVSYNEGFLENYELPDRATVRFTLDGRKAIEVRIRQHSSRWLIEVDAVGGPLRLQPSAANLLYGWVGDYDD